MFLVSCFIFVASCGGKNSAPLSAGDVVATIDGKSITAGELDSASKGSLQRVDQEIYQIKRGVLDDMIQDKLVAQAAEKQGKSVEDYLKENIDAKVNEPSIDEMKTFYEAHKDQMGGKKFEEAKESIKSFIIQRNSQGIRQQLFSGLRAAADVKVKLEPPRADVEVGDAPTIGPKSAKVTIVEFTDYQCPFCGRVRQTINKLIDEYKDNIRYALRDFPLSFHDKAKKAHEAAHCAGEQGKYWEYNKVLWENQRELDVDKLKTYAKNLNLNGEKFNKCLDSGKFTKMVEENAAYGASVGVSGTPAFFVNGISLSGARPYQDFKDIIEDELKK